MKGERAHSPPGSKNRRGRCDPWTRAWMVGVILEGAWAWAAAGPGARCSAWCERRSECRLAPVPNLWNCLAGDCSALGCAVAGGCYAMPCHAMPCHALRPCYGVAIPSLPAPPSQTASTAAEPAAMTATPNTAPAGPSHLRTSQQGRGPTSRLTWAACMRRDGHSLHSLWSRVPPSGRADKYLTMRRPRDI